MEARFFASPEEWHAWLEEHHDTEAEVLVGYWKRGTGRPSLTWPESVDEALCFGWIDGVRRRIDDERYCIRFTPRRPRSRWSDVNVARVAELEREGRMRPAGRAAFAARTEEGTYSYERQQREAALDDARERRLRADAAAWAYFSAQPPGYRRAVVHWVMSAKREETRDRRLAQLVECSAQGRPVPPLRRPG
jgi:uncharacterized protein YdeI (YjbR/CyaY-like superfamily)